MERTEELHKLVTLYAPASNDQVPSSSSSSSSSSSNRYVTIARRVVTNIDGNESLVRRMEKLSTRKEFSNDPTQEMTEISDLFHMKVALIQTDFQLLKQMTEVKVQTAASEGQHQMQHYKLMMQTLNKRHLAHVDAFKAALKVHSENVKQRQKRVGKYGQGQDQVRASLVGTGTSSSSSSSSTGNSNTPNPEQNTGNTPKLMSSASPNVFSAAVTAPSYAMFANQSQTRVEVQIPQELRRRGNVPSHGTATTTSSDMQTQNQMNGDGISNNSSISGPGLSLTSSASGLMNAFTAGPPKSAFINGKPPQYQQQYHHGRQQGTAHAGNRNQYNYNNTYSSSSSGSEYGNNDTGGGYMQMQLQQQAPSSMIQQTRLKSAEQVERSIAQMGQLFSQMATLVMDQSETISRIEDDVEIGLEDTKDAHRSMEEYHAISKGNRGLIVKVFLLLVFFIFLFLVWT